MSQDKFAMKIYPIINPIILIIGYEVSIFVYIYFGQFKTVLFLGK